MVIIQYDTYWSTLPIFEIKMNGSRKYQTQLMTDELLLMSINKMSR